MSNTDAVITAARALISEHAQRQTLQRALREGLRVRPSAAAEVTCTPDPALIEKTRLVVQSDVARIEQFDGEAWREVWRSAPDASPSPAPEPIPEQSSRFGPPVPGQLILTPDGWAFAK
jgi:hypothetical protein